MTLDRPCADRPGAITSVPDLSGAIETFIDGWNERCHPFVWTATADQILDHCKPGPSTSVDELADRPDGSPGGDGITIEAEVMVEPVPARRSPDRGGPVRREGSAVRLPVTTNVWRVTRFGAGRPGRRGP